jgi:hypothetical protein
MHILTVVFGVLLCGAAVDAIASSNKPVVAAGPLRVLQANPRYFTDGSGKAIYLTGSHVWNNLQDWHGHPQLDYEQFLDGLQSLNHNFMRMWAWEHMSVAGQSWPDDPLPYQRIGSKNGHPLFDVSKFNEAYFDRLRSRVKAAQERNIYVSIMLFQGWSVEGKRKPNQNPWPGHPFNVENNVNGIDGDIDRDGNGAETHTLKIPAIAAIQAQYIKKIIDTVNDLDNVLYEISNESHADSQEWQKHFIALIKDYEATKPKQHPVGMTAEYPDGDNAELTESPADWISPHQESIADSATNIHDYESSPIPADGQKVVIVDTDHVWGLGGNPDWVWKTFLRGMNPIFMDLDASHMMNDEFRKRLINPEGVRQAMGQTRDLAERIDLASMTPRSDVTSTGYSLVNEGREYLIYLPEDYYQSRIARLAAKLLRFVFKVDLVRKSVAVDLSAGFPARFTVEWLKPYTSEAIHAGTKTRQGSGAETFTAPFSGSAVLYLCAAD